jgi:preprotein translocase subunit SecE
LTSAAVSGVLVIIRNKEQLVAKKKLAKKKKTNRLVRWVKETSGELKKVNWPTRKEAWSLTKVVITVMVVMAILLFTLDVGFLKVFDLIYAL